jgi:hypothetical protein
MKKPNKKQALRIYYDTRDLMRIKKRSFNKKAVKFYLLNLFLKRKHHEKKVFNHFLYKSKYVNKIHWRIRFNKIWNKQFKKHEKTQ